MRVHLPGLVLALFALAAFSLPAQESGTAPTPDARKVEQLRQLVDRALEVAVEVRLSQGDQLVWSRRDSRFTVPGVGVSMQLEEDNLLIKMTFTPYRNAGDQIYLLVQGQVWMLSGNGTLLQNFSVPKGAPIKPGQVLTFYPLGLPKDKSGQVLSVMIRVDTVGQAQIQEVLENLKGTRGPDAGTNPPTGGSTPPPPPPPPAGDRRP